MYPTCTETRLSTIYKLLDNFTYLYVWFKNLASYGMLTTVYTTLGSNSMHSSECVAWEEGRGGQFARLGGWPWQWSLYSKSNCEVQQLHTHIQVLAQCHSKLALPLLHDHSPQERMAQDVKQRLMLPGFEVVESPVKSLWIALDIVLEAVKRCCQR